MKFNYLFLLFLLFYGEFSCVFDPYPPLQNDTPVCLNLQTVYRHMFYPDTSVCTLSVEDMNDTSLALEYISNSQPDTLPWIGSYTYNKTYGQKNICIYLDTEQLGIYTGSFSIKDIYGARINIPFTIEHEFCDQFDTFPISNRNWTEYCSGPDNKIFFDHLDRKLHFLFTPSDTSTALTTGIRSNFRVSGDFDISIDMKLRDEMVDGFTVAFFISTSPDTGKWDGDIAGIFISGEQNRIQLECKSVILQSFIREENIPMGRLQISRHKSELSYFYYSGNPNIKPEKITSHIYPEHEPIYVHCKMQVTDLKKQRHCFFNNFSVSRGSIEFKTAKNQS